MSRRSKSSHRWLERCSGESWPWWPGNQAPLRGPGAMCLAALALEMAQRVLKPRGTALIKVFEGAGLQELVRAARNGFVQVRLCKPRASRSRSPEMYLLAKDFLMV